MNKNHVEKYKNYEKVLRGFNFFNIFLFLFSYVYMFFKTLDFLSFAAWIELIIISWILLFKVKSLKRRSYSFFVLVSLLLIFSIRDTFRALFYMEDHHFFYVYLFYIFSEILLLTLTRHPLFYPLVQWWEYDFRFRGDIKGVLLVEEEEVSMRSFDFKGGACAIDIFRELKINYVYKVKFYFEEKNFIESEVVVVTELNSIQGRSMRFGVYILDTDENIDKIEKRWRYTKRLKFRKKFKPQSKED